MRYLVLVLAALCAVVLAFDVPTGDVVKPIQVAGIMGFLLVLAFFAPKTFPGTTE